MTALRIAVAPQILCAFAGLRGGLSFRSPTTRKWLWRRLVRGRHNEELDDRRPESIGELLEQRDGWVFQPAFESAYVGSVDTGVAGESFL